MTKVEQIKEDKDAKYILITQEGVGVRVEWKGYNSTVEIQIDLNTAMAAVHQKVVEATQQRLVLPTGVRGTLRSV